MKNIKARIYTKYHPLGTVEYMVMAEGRILRSFYCRDEAICFRNAINEVKNV